MVKFGSKIKNVIKDKYQDIIRYFPGKLKDNEKQELLKTQIYPFGKNLIEVLKTDSYNRLYKINFTVSPVAEYATFISENIVSQAFAGKCILRSVVHEISKKYENVFYFPSFEFVLADNPSSFVADNMHVKRKKVFLTE